MKKVVFILLTFILSAFILPQNAFAQTPPGDVTGVLVEYPECQGDSCSFVQASCKWDAVSGATSYTYTITEEDTSTEIQSATVDSSTLRVVFPITQERTYRCDVFATNSSGQSGGTGSHSLLCSTDGLVENTPTPTIASATATPTFTPTPLPTKPPIDDPGAFETTALVIGGIMILMVGGVVLMLL